MSAQDLTILCLHGHPGSGDSMSIFVQHFRARGIKVIAPDLRGYGKTKTNQPFSMAAHIDDLVHLLEQHNVKRCLVIGWSLGGILAMELAWRIPEKIAGLILIATAARPRSSHPSVPWWQVVNTALAVLAYKLFPKQSWAMRIGKQSLLQYLIQQHTEYAYARIANEGTRAFLQTSRLATQALQQALREGYDRTTDLHKITVPCLMLAGECDRHITAVASQETAALLPNCPFLCYPHTAHLLPWEIPAQILADIERWLFASGLLQDYKEQRDSLN